MRDQNTYDFYAKGHEDLSVQRRSYSVAYLALFAALLVGPYAVVRPGMENYLIPAILLSSMVGLIVNEIWRSIVQRYRAYLRFRMDWLILLEAANELPLRQRIFSFENIHLYRRRERGWFRSPFDVHHVGIASAELNGILLFTGLHVIHSALALAVGIYSANEMSPAISIKTILAGRLWEFSTDAVLIALGFAVGWIVFCITVCVVLRFLFKYQPGSDLQKLQNEIRNLTSGLEKKNLAEILGRIAVTQNG